MKIKDPTGREVDIALVVKPAANALFGAGVDWMRPVSHRTEDSNKTFLRMPEGNYAIRVMSKSATEMLVHVSGKLVLRTQVEPGLQYIRKDGAGNYLLFGTASEQPNVVASDAEKIAMLSSSATTNGATKEADDSVKEADLFSGENLEGGPSQDDANALNFEQLPLLPDAEENSVFIVVRFVDEPGPGLKPPAQEYEMVFQMNKPADHDELVATRNLLTMVKPSLLINEQDEVSFEPPQNHRPTFTCTCTGCVRGSN